MWCSTREANVNAVHLPTACHCVCRASPEVMIMAQLSALRRGDVAGAAKFNMKYNSKVKTLNPILLSHRSHSNKISFAFPLLRARRAICSFLHSERFFVKRLLTTCYSPTRRPKSLPLRGLPPGPL